MLTKIKLIKQPSGSNWCGASCLAMIMKYLGVPFSDQEEIWNNISDVSPNGRQYCKTYKIGKYANDKGLLSTIIRYKQLQPLLSYCEKNQVPTILNHHSFENKELGHFTVFVKYNGASVIIRDPENEKRTSVKYNDLEVSSQKSSVSDEIGGNIAIVINTGEIDSINFPCPNCLQVNKIDKGLLAIKDAIECLICHECDSGISIEAQ